MDLHQSIRRAYPDALLKITGSTSDDLVVTDLENDQPFAFDQALVDAAAAEIQAELDATQYQRDRQPEYPSLADLADALYWSNQGDNTKLDEYYAACAAVKAKYPKP